MQDTIGERFKYLIKELGKTNNSFAISIGKTSSTINYIVDGKSKPSYDVLDAIFSTYPDVNPTWLMKGEGQIFSLPITKDDSQRELEDLVKRLSEHIIVKDRQIEKLIDLLGKEGSNKHNIL